MSLSLTQFLQLILIGDKQRKKKKKKTRDVAIKLALIVNMFLAFSLPKTTLDILLLILTK